MIKKSNFFMIPLQYTISHYGSNNLRTLWSENSMNGKLFPHIGSKFSRIIILPIEDLLYLNFFYVNEL